MNKEHPEWTPPPREFGGEDIERLFACYLVEEAVASMNAGRRIEDSPIASGMDDLVQENAEMVNRLRENQHFFDVEDSNLFVDYKMMSNEAFRAIGRSEGALGELPQIIAGRNYIMRSFYPEMSTGEALEVALEIVSFWNWWEDIDELLEAYLYFLNPA